MKKNNIRGLIALGISLLVYNLIVFIVPFFIINGMFWLSYGFTMTAFIVQIPVMTVAFRYGESSKSKFYGFPVARIGVLYLLIQLVWGLVCMLLSAWIPIWLGVVINVMLFAAAAVGFIAADAVRETIEEQDQKLKVDVATMRRLQSDVAALALQCENTALAKEISKLAESLRYSDPVSKPALAQIEAELTACVEELHRAGDEQAIVVCQRAERILIERNRLCKLTK